MTFRGGGRKKQSTAIYIARGGNSEQRAIRTDQMDSLIACSVSEAASSEQRAAFACFALIAAAGGADVPSGTCAEIAASITTRNVDASLVSQKAAASLINKYRDSHRVSAACFPLIGQPRSAIRYIALIFGLSLAISLLMCYATSKARHVQPKKRQTAPPPMRTRRAMLILEFGGVPPPHECRKCIGCS